MYTVEVSAEVSAARFFCPEMLVVGLAEVFCVIDVVVSYAQKVPVWVRFVVDIFLRINHDVLPDFVESLCWER